MPSRNTSRPSRWLLASIRKLPYTALTGTVAEISVPEFTTNDAMREVGFLIFNQIHGNTHYQPLFSALCDLVPSNRLTFLTRQALLLASEHLEIAEQLLDAP